MKILINTPDLSGPGGVINHYKGLKSYWPSDVTYNEVGKRKGIPTAVIFIYDYLKFTFLCLFGKYSIILLNPSLGKTAIKRDALFLKIAKLFKIKTVVFFHGWSNDMIDKLNKSSVKFSLRYNQADKIIVLAQSFKTDLIKWGITKPIFITSTKVNDDLLSGFDFKKKPWSLNILFLTRVEKYKGIFTTLEAFIVVKEKFPSAKLTIAGDGTKLSLAKDFVAENNIPDVHFLGNIAGNELIKAFSNASMYILPSYSEGMPTSVLEAMAFGLPIISRPVGGLVDFFEKDKMGYLIESFQPEEYAEKIMILLENLEKCKEIGKYNHEYAKKHFLASKVAQELDVVLQN